MVHNQEARENNRELRSIVLRYKARSSQFRQELEARAPKFRGDEFVVTDGNGLAQVYTATSRALCLRAGRGPDIPPPRETSLRLKARPRLFPN